jgi:hypothetical protein
MAISIATPLPDISVSGKLGGVGYNLCPAWGRIKELYMSNQAQVDAVERLLMALLKSNQMSLTAYKVFDQAEGLIAGSDGPPGAEEKSAAAEYLKHLKRQL